MENSTSVVDEENGHHVTIAFLKFWLNSALKKLVIFGVGLIGGSVALALKKAGSAAHIVGVGRSEKSLNEALKLGVIDALQTNIHAGLQRC